jgi:putative ABC transport system permease protein
VQDQADIKREINQQFDVLFIFVYALLGLSILVAFLGIVNTLSLSVYERFREIGLLRAVGMTRRQIRRMISTEALWIAVLGTVLGTVIGLIYGTLFQRILATEGITYLDIPWLQIGFFIVAGSVGGLVASIWPAWRASRMRILSAISTE